MAVEAIIGRSFHTTADLILSLGDANQGALCLPAAIIKKLGKLSKKSEVKMKEATRLCLARQTINVLVTAERWQSG